MSAKIPGEAHVIALHTGPGASCLTLPIGAPPGHGNYQSGTPEAAAVSMAKGDATIHECAFLERDAFPKTPSSEIQRNRCHALMQASSIEPLATIRLAGR